MVAGTQSVFPGDVDVQTIQNLRTFVRFGGISARLGLALARVRHSASDPQVRRARRADRHRGALVPAGRHHAPGGDARSPRRKALDAPWHGYFGTG